MKTATAEKKLGAAAPKPYRNAIDLGNGVMFPVGSEDEAEFVEWMVKEAVAGRASLPKKAPGPVERPVWLDTDPQITGNEFWAFYKNERADRI